jgi:hypothetical protein
MWDRLPYHRIGVRAYMRATYDHGGLNSDPSNFLYQEADDFNVVLDTAGPGSVYFVRTNHHHGSPWHYEIDGKDLIVKETATDNPVGANVRLTDSTFIPQDLFPSPLTVTWPTTKGADLMWRPILFEDSFRLAYSRTFYGTGYFIYHQFGVGNDHLSRDISKSQLSPPDQRVLQLLNSAGTDIGPQGPEVSVCEGVIDLHSNEIAKLPDLAKTPSTIRALKFIVPRDQVEEFGNCRVRITWDNRRHASIDAPVALFFGAARIPSRHSERFLIQGLPVVVRYADNEVHMECYWPMPYFENAAIEIENRSDRQLSGIRYHLRTVPYRDPPNHVGYFHATYADHPAPKLGADLVFLDTQQAEGGGLWSGNFVGMSWIFTRRGRLETLEGDPRFFFDGCRTPQAWGTGTEEWGGGGDYWGGLNMTLPLAGHPLGRQAGKEKSPVDLVNSAYRFLIADLFPFGNRAVIGLEHGGVNESNEHYSGVTYWYGSPFPTLVLTDQVNVCDPVDCTAHDYASPTALPPYRLASRYELGPDHSAPLPATASEGELPKTRQFIAVEDDTVRVMRGTTEFTVHLDPQNEGALLRRKFDYQYPNQRARVSVRPVDDHVWRNAGEWCTAGSNTCVRSALMGENFSAGELGATKHDAYTSNRRWREEEFLISRPLTKGVDRLRVRIEWAPENRPLYPGQRFPIDNQWSESRYWVFCYQLPNVE